MLRVMTIAGAVFMVLHDRLTLSPLLYDTV